MKYLIFGKHGQVGQQLNKLLQNRDEVTALDIEDLDLTNLAAIDEQIRSLAPDWVLNASAYTAVDQAESDLELATTINVAAPQAMAQACAQTAARLFHYSTDYVFDGEADRPYLESDPTSPKSVYGQTKLDGELAVLAALPDTIILRTAWVYTRQGKNFVNTMLQLAQKMDQINVVNDQYGSPTLADDLAIASVQIIDKVNSGSLHDVGGVYHATGTGQINWSGFAEEIFKLSGCENVRVNPIPGSEYPTPAARPNWSVLSNEKLMRVFGVKLPAWQDALRRSLQASG